MDVNSQHNSCVTDTFGEQLVIILDDLYAIYWLTLFSKSSSGCLLRGLLPYPLCEMVRAEAVGSCLDL